MNTEKTNTSDCYFNLVSLNTVLIQHYMSVERIQSLLLIKQEVLSQSPGFSPYDVNH